MVFDPPAFKCLILTVAAIVVLTLVCNVGYGLICCPWAGMSLPAVLREVEANASYLVLGLFLAAVGVILGAQLTARWPEMGPWWILAVGVGFALVVIMVGWVRSSLDFWLFPNAAMAVIGCWLGERLAR